MIIAMRKPETVKMNCGGKELKDEDIPCYYVKYLSRYSADEAQNKEQENEPSAKPAINNTDVTNSEPVTPQAIENQAKELSKHIEAKSGRKTQETTHTK